MKLLFSIKRLEDMAGGAERVLLQVISGLEKNYGHQITMVTFDRKSAQSFYNVPMGIKWIKLGIGDSSRRSSAKETFKRILELRKVIKSERPDCLVSFQHSTFIPVAVSAMALGIPHIASEHIVPAHYKSRPIEYILLILAGMTCRKITVLSEAIISMYPKCIRARMVAVPNPVMRLKERADVAGGGRRKILLSVGRLDPQKDQKTLIEAFGYIASDFPEWDLRIIGEGSLREDLENQVADLALTNRIFLPGIRADIYREYLSAQVFALASTYESFGLSTAEAMSAGLPVIGFADCPGTNELIKNAETGMLVETHEGETRAMALSHVLRKLLSDVYLRKKLGEAAYKDTARYSDDSVVAKWDEIIRNSVVISKES